MACWRGRQQKHCLRGVPAEADGVYMTTSQGLSAFEIIEYITIYGMNTAYHVEFLTATILNWQKLLEDDSFKQVIVNSLQWLTIQKRCKIYVFVIMPNHIHLLWQMEDGNKRKEVQGALFSYTAHEFQRILREKNDTALLDYRVNAKDRNYQFWQRNPMVKECWSEHFFLQKMNYIHHNPCQPHWNLARYPEEYPWSSAAFYEKGDKKFEWITHYFG